MTTEALLAQIRDEIRGLRADIGRQSQIRAVQNAGPRGTGNGCKACGGSGQLGPAEIDNCGVCNPRRAT